MTGACHTGRTPAATSADQINTWDGGRGVYFNDPNGHLLEIITRPYGSGGTTASRVHPLFAATGDDQGGRSDNQEKHGDSLAAAERTDVGRVEK